MGIKITKAQEENKKVVQRFHEALAAMDWKKMEEILADDAVMGMPGQPRTQGGKQIMANLAEHLATNLQITSLRCEIMSLAVVGPWVIDDRIDWVGFGDQEAGVHVAGSYLVEDGKILDWTEWVSTEDSAEMRKLSPSGKVEPMAAFMVTDSK